MSYELVLSPTEPTSQFIGNGEEVLIIKVGTSTVSLGLNFPDGSGRSEVLATYTANSNQRYRVPMNTPMYLSASNSDATVWRGSVPLDTAGLKL